MLCVKVHLHRLEKAQINLASAVDFLGQHFQQVVTLDTAIFHIVDLANSPHESPVCILRVIGLRVDELHHFILTLFVLLFELVSQLSLLLHKLVINFDVERVAKEERVSARAGSHGLKLFLVLLQHWLKPSNETLAQLFLETAHKGCVFQLSLVLQVLDLALELLFNLIGQICFLELGLSLSEVLFRQILRNLECVVDLHVLFLFQLFSSVCHVIGQFAHVDGDRLLSVETLQLLLVKLLLRDPVLNLLTAPF